MVWGESSLVATINLTRAQIETLVSGRTVVCEDEQGGFVNIYPERAIRVSGLKLGVVDSGVTVKRKDA